MNGQVDTSGGQHVEVYNWLFSNFYIRRIIGDVLTFFDFCSPVSPFVC